MIQDIHLIYIFTNIIIQSIIIHIIFQLRSENNWCKLSFRKEKKNWAWFELTKKNLKSIVLPTMLLSRLRVRKIYQIINCSVIFETYFLNTTWRLYFMAAIFLCANYTLSIHKRSLHSVSRSSGPSLLKQLFTAGYSFYIVYLLYFFLLWRKNFVHLIVIHIYIYRVFHKRWTTLLEMIVNIQTNNIHERMPGRI